MFGLYHLIFQLEVTYFDKVNFMKFSEVGDKEVWVNDALTRKGEVVDEL